jgi:hypothetical protein
MATTSVLAGMTLTSSTEENRTPFIPEVVAMETRAWSWFYETIWTEILHTRANLVNFTFVIMTLKGFKIPSIQDKVSVNTQLN